MYQILVVGWYPLTCVGLVIPVATCMSIFLGINEAPPNCMYIAAPIRGWYFLLVAIMQCLFPYREFYCGVFFFFFL